MLRLPGEPFDGKDMVVSVFAKGLFLITGTRPADRSFDTKKQKQQYELRVKRMDVDFDRKLTELHAESQKGNLWKGTPAWSDRAQYWTAGVEAYFDAAGAGWAPNLADRPITTRAALKAYDPGLFALVDETMAYKEHQDWRVGP